ncbi:uncharacterized protein LOC141628572 [Silene latifolia]|uniref:uncharacterized protein LOC141628572 n=1 Tax=Silene latifolia TaxID=37657 RepID=UPI003D76EF2D
MTGEGISQTENTVPKIDPLSPFYLGSGDMPNIKISTILLNHHNYDNWSRAMRMSLKSRRKFGFCDGTVTKPTDATLLGQWEVVHCTIVSWLRATIDPTVLESIPYVEDAAAMWNDLAERFAVVDGTSIHTLKTELSECRQKKGMSVTQYFGKLKSLWDALSLHEPPFACECGKCTCDIANKAIKRLDNERLHQFFMGLDRSLYGNLRNQQFQLVPLPTLNRGYHAALHAERLHQTDVPAEAIDIVAYATPGVSRTPEEWKAIREKEKAERRKLFCSHCEVNGHDINSCFIKSQKFPDWWGTRPRTLAELRRSKKTSSGTGPSGALGSGVGSSSSGTVHANALQTIPSDRLSGTFVSWIIDTGASNHVTGDLSLFTDSMVIPPRDVGLPNGKQILACQMGTVRINGSITLRRVLFVPHLTCHLISVSQLTADNDYILQFTKDRCVIQDRPLRKMIGVGELRDGLFILSSTDSAPTVHTLDTSGSYELWHRRLGHPGGNVVQFLPLPHSLSVNKSLVCDVCHRAKQTRASFNLSENITSDIFSLIHCDHWGPYRVLSTCGAKYFLTIVDDCSRSVWVYLLLAKTEVTSVFMQFLSMVNTQFSKQVKVVRSDNGTEFHHMADYFLQQGIQFQTSCVGTPQQNGRVERKHRHILNVARALLFQG